MRFSSLVERVHSPGVAAWDIHHEAHAAKRRGEDVIVLSIGDPDFATPDPIVRRAIAALESGDTHYTDIPGRPELREAIAALQRRRSGRALTPENVMVVAGAQNGLFASSLCLFEPGDEVIVLEPMYVTYEATFEAAGARIVPVRLTGQQFALDPAALRRAVTPRTRAIAFATPSNPTGKALTRAELGEIAAVACEHDLAVLADETYEALVFEGEHVSIGALPGMTERSVTVGSLSKSHAMTGWRLGWVIGPEVLVVHLERLALTMFYGLPGFIQEGALEALRHYDEITAAMRDTYRRRRDLLAGHLASCPGVRVVLPDAGMFVLLDIRATGLSSLDFAWALYRATGVAVLDASAFGSSAQGFVRVSFTTGEVELAEASRRIGQFLRGLESETTASMQRRGDGPVA